MKCAAMPLFSSNLLTCRVALDKEACLVASPPSPATPAWFAAACTPVCSTAATVSTWVPLAIEI